MKKTLQGLIILVLCVSFIVVGCGKSGGGSKRPTIRLITDVTGIDDASYNAAAWRGILEFYGDTWDNQSNRGTFYDVVASQTQDLYVSNLKQVSDEGYDLICVAGFTFADAVAEVAPLYPEQKYMIIDVDGLDLPNVTEFVFAEEQGSYLAGAAAALQSIQEGVANPSFGFIGGVPGAAITRFEMGFVQGVRSILPEATFVDYYLNSWNRPELAKAQTKNWFDAGVYAVFAAAGRSGAGTITQAKEYRSQGKTVWAIGVDSDQYEVGLFAENMSSVLTSAVKKVENAMTYALKEFSSKKNKEKVVYFDIKTDSVGYSSANTELYPSVVEQVEEIKKNILDGNVTIHKTYADALAAGVAPEGLAALDF
ncbi:MAG: BMP family lipoprotein [Treponemataceae bacterium]